MKHGNKLIFFPHTAKSELLHGQALILNKEYQHYSSSRLRVVPPSKEQNIDTDILVLGFYGYIENIGRYFYKNIDKEKINKNTLKFMEILC